MNIFKKMMMSGAALLTGLSIMGAASAASLETTLNSSLRLYQGERFVCSAVAVSPTQIVTAAHCIDKVVSRRNLSIQIEEYDRIELIRKLTLPVKVVRTNYDDDTAFIEFKSDHELSSWVTIAEEYSPKIGEQVFAIGYPRGGELTITDGMFTAETTLEREMGVKGDYWKVTVPITGGSSGGGLYHRDWDPVTKEYTFSLIGLATANYRDVSFQSYFSTLEAVKKNVRSLIKLPPERVVIPKDRFEKGTEKDMEGNDVIMERGPSTEVPSEQHLDAWKDLEK